jgi:hypothetical protein
MTSEPKCSFKFGNLDFKEIAICKPESRIFSIKNNSRVPAIFHIDSTKLPECSEVNPPKGKIAPDDSRDITVQ